MKVMKRRFFLTLFLIFLAGCGKNYVQKEITLSSGNKINVSFEKMRIDGKQTVLTVDYKTDERKIKEDEVEKEGLDIWNGVKAEAETLGLEEALIRYSFFSGEKTKQGGVIHQLLVFEATKTETGKWTVRKVY